MKILTVLIHKIMKISGEENVKNMRVMQHGVADTEQSAMGATWGRNTFSACSALLTMLERWHEEHAPTLRSPHECC